MEAPHSASQRPIPGNAHEASGSHLVPLDKETATMIRNAIDICQKFNGLRTKLDVKATGSVIALPKDTVSEIEVRFLFFDHQKSFFKVSHLIHLASSATQAFRSELIRYAHALGELKAKTIRFAHQRALMPLPPAVRELHSLGDEFEYCSKELQTMIKSGDGNITKEGADRICNFISRLESYSTLKTRVEEMEKAGEKVPADGPNLQHPIEKHTPHELLYTVPQ